MPTIRCAPLPHATSSALSGGSPREGARSELASAAATGGGGPQAPPTPMSSRPGRSRVEDELALAYTGRQVSSLNPSLNGRPSRQAAEAAARELSFLRRYVVLA